MTMVEIEAKLKSLNQKYEQGIKQFFSMPANQITRRSAQAIENRQIDHELTGYRELAARIREANNTETNQTKKIILPSKI